MADKITCNEKYIRLAYFRRLKNGGYISSEIRFYPLAQQLND
jgi:hypothetical protein